MKNLANALLLVGLTTSCVSLENCSSQSRQNAEAVAAAPAQLEGLELVWRLRSASGWKAKAIASDSSVGLIYAIGTTQNFKGLVIAEITSSGKLEREFRIKKWNGRLRMAHLSNKVTRDLVMFPLAWVGSGVVASDTNGNILWTHTEGQGIDDVWVADLDGDGFDEVIVGYNGFTGLHVLDHDGKLLWKNGQGANVWRVSAADLDGDGRPEVITTWARGSIRVFKSNGVRVKDIEPPSGYYGNLVCPIQLTDSPSQGILLTGASNRVAALRGDGTLAWEVELPTSLAGDVAEPAPGMPWIAFIAGGRIAVLNTLSGSIIGRTITGKDDRGSGNCDACWVTVKGEASPLLILSMPGRIDAYRVTGDKKLADAVRPGGAP
jgi:hypothetical protein